MCCSSYTNVRTERLFSFKFSACILPLSSLSFESMATATTHYQLLIKVLGVVFYPLHPDPSHPSMGTFPQGGGAGGSPL